MVIVSNFLKLIPHYMLPKKLLTTLAGKLANLQQTEVKNFLIKNFIQRFNVNMQEALEENPENYPTFNDFFIRKLKPNLRQISRAPIVSPVDGTISEFGIIIKNQLIQAKGINYTTEQLLACNPAKAKAFQDGLFITLYLSPKDYHRVHMPVDGTLTEMIYIPGKLFSVNPVLQKNREGLFAKNERIVAFFDTKFGKMAMVMVGATIVGNISTSWHGQIRRTSQKQRFLYPSIKKEKTFYAKGEEIGYFNLGSTVILLFANGHNLTWEEDCLRNHSILLGQKLIKDVSSEQHLD